MRTLVLVGVLVLLGLSGAAQAQIGPAPSDHGAGETASRAPRPDVTDADVQRAFNAIDRATGYEDLRRVLQRHQDVVRSPRALVLLDRALSDPALNATQRGALALARQTAVDCGERGPTVAAQFLSIRLIASAALAAETPAQLAAVLEKFSELAPVITPRLVRAALDVPGHAWPGSLLPLMEQLAVDWPARGALPAANRMASAASQAQDAARGAESPRPAADGQLVGHWRTTRIVFETPRDDNLILHPDGSAERWSVTATSREPRARGRWTSQGSTLSVTWDTGEQMSQPFTFHQGQLVLPNVQGGRRFWDRLR